VFIGSILKQLQFQCWTNPLIRRVEKLWCILYNKYQNKEERWRKKHPVRDKQ